VNQHLVHTLGTAGPVLTTGLILAAFAVLTLGAAPAVARARHRRAVRHRTRALIAPGPAAPPPVRAAALPPAWWPRGERARIWALSGAAGIGVAVLVGGWAGPPAGLVAGAAMRRQLGRAARRTEAPDPARDPRLPLLADLLAACLAAGAAPGPAAEAVGRAVGGPLGASLREIAAELRLGGDPAECWHRLGVRDLARCMARAAQTGVPPVGEAARVATALRAARSRRAAAGARRAGVLATAPLGLCFLPAFLLVGVVPVVVGLAGTILGGAGH
jgi:hypothetical protein